VSLGGKYFCFLCKDFSHNRLIFDHHPQPNEPRRFRFCVGDDELSLCSVTRRSSRNHGVLEGGTKNEAGAVICDGAWAFSVASAGSYSVVYFGQTMLAAGGSRCSERQLHIMQKSFEGEL
jgi:hypothetical protein